MDYELTLVVFKRLCRIHEKTDEKQIVQVKLLVQKVSFSK